MASEAVLKYLVDTNRPYSCADITVNLRGAYSKTVVQKTLDVLVESGKIRCKLYGKQKVYAAIQIDGQDGDSDTEDYDGQLKSLTQALEEKSTALRTLEGSLKALTSTPTTLAAKAQLDEVAARIEALESKLELLRNSAQVISADEKKCITDEHSKLAREYRKRKRISMDILDAVLESNPKSKKTLIVELCLETDEMAEFQIVYNV